MSSPGLASASAPPVSPPLPAAVLWDMDGTLVDTEGYWMDAETALVESFGGSWTHEQALTLVGSGLDRSGEILQDAGVRMTVPDIVAHLTRVVSERLATDGNPFRPGAVELLRALRAQGVRTALVTMSLRDMALIRQTALEFDTLKPEAVIARLKPIVDAKDPASSWFPSAAELSATAYYQMGRFDEAGKLYGRVAKTPGISKSLQSRAVQMAGMLGVDAVADRAAASIAADAKRVAERVAANQKGTPEAAAAATSEEAK